MRTPSAGTIVLLALLVCGPAAARGETVLGVDPDAGNNTFSAVFDAVVGERITAVTSAVGCTLRVDERTLVGQATCSVPLTAIRVDNDDTKTDHFRQWATNKSVEPGACALALQIGKVALETPVAEMKPLPFETTGTFTVCGRPRDDGGSERIAGTITHLPAGDGGRRRFRIRAKIEGFDRERYRIGPKWTPGWVARVQELAPVVAAAGTIEATLFAVEPAAR